jgi:cell division septum initiation protein DivIVA
MWRDIAATLKAVITLAEELKQNREEIKDLRQDLEELTQAVADLSAKVKAAEGIKATEQENILLRVQNALLLFEKRLPPPKD